MKPNTDQIGSAARNALTAIIAYAAGRHWLGEDTATLLLALLPLAGPFAWGLLAHTTSAKIAAVEAIPEVQQIVIGPSDENSALHEIVKDEERKKVVPDRTDGR